MRRDSRGTRPGSRVTPIHALFAAAMLGLLVMPLAIAGAQGGKAVSRTGSKSQIKSLKRRVAALEQRPASAIPTTLPPSGRAGGVLQGSYPNPSGLAADSVGGTQIIDGGVVSGDLADQSVGIRAWARMSSRARTSGCPAARVSHEVLSA